MSKSRKKEDITEINIKTINNEVSGQENQPNASYLQQEQEGINLFLSGDLKSASGIFKELTEISPDIPNGYALNGLTLYDMGRSEEALVSFKKARELHENYIYDYFLSKIYLTLGHKKDALQLLENALKSHEDNPFLLHRYILFHKKVESADDPHVSHLKALEQQDLDPRIKLLIFDALRKTNEDLKNYDAAFEYATKAANINKNLTPYDAKIMEGLLGAVKTYFSKDHITELQKLPATQSSMPIFIFGMPRSGTSLLEQILSAHHEIGGVGEDGHFLDLAIQKFSLPDFEEAPYPFKGVPGTEPEEVSPKEIGDAYCEYLKSRHPDKNYVVNKAMTNFLLAGMIKLCLPNAIFIHCKRNPLDTSLSSYMRVFEIGTQGYTNDLQELGTYYQWHEDMLAYWEEMFPGSVIDVQYETLVDNFEEEARRIIESAGLEWDENCLEFYKAKTSVQTASTDQIRQPIYKSSVNKWKNYEKHLAPLIEGLGKYAPN